MSVRLILVRHGQTDALVAGRSQGRADNPLNPLGRQQAEAVGQRLLEYAPAAIRSSPLARAVATAQPLATALGLEVISDERLLEMDYGELDGLTGVEMRERAPEFLRRWSEEDPTDLRMPGGETLREVQQRMSSMARSLAGAHEGECVALFSHNLALRTLVCYALGLPLAAFRQFRVDLASFTVLDLGEDGYRLVLLNELCHLQG